jgi:hypothetical protein
MKHIMKLTGRHVFPAECEAQIFPDNISDISDTFDDFEEEITFLKKMADYAIPRDTTELVVFMSGYRRLAVALEEVCSSRCINMKKMFLRKDKEVVGDKQEDYVRVTASTRKLLERLWRK